MVERRHATFFGRILVSGDKLLKAFPVGATAAQVIDVLIPFVAISRLQDSDENVALRQAIKVAGGINKTAVNTIFTSEQKDRDNAKAIQGMKNKSENANYAGSGNKGGNKRPP